MKRPGMTRPPAPPTPAKPEPRPPVVEDHSVVEMVNATLQKAVAQGASDIHFEPSAQHGGYTRFRVKNVLARVGTHSEDDYLMIVNRVKVISGLDITQKKIPQRGFFAMIFDNRKVEFDVYDFPTILGEKMVLKIQYRREIELRLGELSMQPKVLEGIERLLKKPNGLLLVVGPPGSGKTTTLYAALNYLNSPDKNICTYEPVIKFDLPGIIQGKPPEESVARSEEALRSLLNQGPDVLLVGEIQAPEIAKLTIQASFAKRVVLGRMIADNATTALFSLMEMGIPTFLLTAAVSGVLSQRLIRKLCTSCREAYTPSESLCNELGVKPSPDLRFFAPRGCLSCDNTGYRGFTAIFELFIPDDEINELILGRETSKTVRNAAIKKGMITLKRDGMLKASQGITSLEEVMNAI